MLKWQNMTNHLKIVLITLLAKGDAIEYVHGSHSQFSRYVPLTLLLHSHAILFCHFLRHTLSQNLISHFYALDSGDNWTYVLSIK